jgi:uncharacterized membrane protein YoaK (UPF0700 family)
MPIAYLRRIAGPERSESANRQLAQLLAFVAGAVNAGGFLAVHQYTSHMSGLVSAMADNVALGSVRLAGAGLAAVLAFVCGAATTALLMRWGRRRNLNGRHAWPLVVEAALLVGFGLRGRVLAGSTVLGTVMLLTYTMGLQNAIVTKISGAVIRTTHVTGMLTDIGIKLGRMAESLLHRLPAMREVQAAKLWLLVSLVSLFFAGGVTGAVGFKQLGFIFTLPLAGFLLVLAAVPIADDYRPGKRAAG